MAINTSTPKGGTPGRESMGTAVAPGLIQRITQGVRYVVNGAPPSTWFGPFNPLAPLAQEEEKGARGRALDYPVGYNQRLRPRNEEVLDFAALRNVADGLDILRIVMETRKDQIAAYEWHLVPVDETKKKDQGVLDQVKAASLFLEKPSTEHDWDGWLRAFLEDMFVLDAVAVFPRLNRGGQVMSLDLIDPATLRRVIDAYGRTPVAPDPAFQQVLHGVPAVDYSADELVYFMRNPRTHKLYGYGPVEQIIVTINTAIRKALWQLQYFTEGNIPEALAGVPETWSPDQIATFQQWWDSIMEGNTAQRRHMVFLPLDPSKVKFSKDPTLKDQFDDWLARVVCFAFSIPPTPFVKETNRATAETTQQAAMQEGIMPLLTFVARKITYIVHKHLGMQDIEFKFKVGREVGPVEQSTILTNYVKNGILSLDEAREDLGREPIGVGHLVYTASGVQPLEEAVDRAREDLVNPPEPIMPGGALGPDGMPIKGPPGAKGTKVPPGAKGKASADAEGGKQGSEPEEKAQKMLEGLLTQVGAALTRDPPKPEVTINMGDTLVSVPPATSPHIVPTHQE